MSVILVECRREKRLASSIMQDLHHAVRRWFHATLNGSREDVLVLKMPFTQVLASGVVSRAPTNGECFRELHLLSTADCGRSTELHGGGPRHQTRQTGRGRPGCCCRAQEGQWPPADLSQAQGEDVGQLRPHPRPRFLSILTYLAGFTTLLAHVGSCWLMLLSAGF